MVPFKIKIKAFRSPILCFLASLGFVDLSLVLSTSHLPFFLFINSIVLATGLGIAATVGMATRASSIDYDRDWYSLAMVKETCNECIASQDRINYLIKDRDELRNALVALEVDND